MNESYRTLVDEWQRLSDRLIANDQEDTLAWEEKRPDDRNRLEEEADQIRAFQVELMPQMVQALSHALNQVDDWSDLAHNMVACWEGIGGGSNRECQFCGRDIDHEGNCDHEMTCSTLVVQLLDSEIMPEALPSASTDPSVTIDDQTVQFIQELENIWLASTPGVWHSKTKVTHGQLERGQGNEAVVWSDGHTEYIFNAFAYLMSGEANAAFAVMAHNRLPVLISLLRAHRERDARIRTRLDAFEETAAGLDREAKEIIPGTSADLYGVDDALESQADGIRSVIEAVREELLK